MLGFSQSAFVSNTEKSELRTTEKQKYCD